LNSAKPILHFIEGVLPLFRLISEASPPAFHNLSFCESVFAGLLV